MIRANHVRPTWRDANASALDLHLRRLRCLLERRARWLRHQWGHDPRRDYAAQIISEAHADWLLRGEDRAEQMAFYAADPDSLALAQSAAELKAEIARQVSNMGRNPPALDVLTHVFHLSDFERDILLLCLAPELDPTFSTLYAYLHDDLTRRAPSPHLAYALFDSDQPDVLSEGAPLRRCHLLHLMHQPPQPIASSALYLDERMVDYLRGVNRPDERLAPLMRPLQPGLITAEGQAQAARTAGHLSAWRRETGAWLMVNLVGAPNSGQRELAHAVCAQMGIQAHRLDLARLDAAHLALLERESLLLQAAFYVELDDEQTIRLALDAARQSAPLILASREPLRLEQPALTLTLARPTAHERIALWGQALNGSAEAVDLDALVEQFEFGAGAIARTASAARQRADLDGSPLTAAHIRAASRETGSAALDELAQRIQPGFTWHDLVLPDAALDQLHEIAAQVNQRYTVYERWGFASSRGRGISALFAGPSGTGKTMTAEVLAGHLDLTLYRVDLAGMISKYVGETEKNIKRVFEAAEQRGVILFFDEADALFGKRTEVKDSHDRFANIEINYLLQKMEAFPGMAILATNRRGALDRAFLRRLRFVVEFPFPDAALRRRMWERVFPPGVPLAALDYDRLARLEIAGGNIRNIAVNAAFLAAHRGEPVTMDHLYHAARREYAKIEKLETEAEFGG
jgi:hypothetical protein